MSKLLFKILLSFSLLLGAAQLQALGLGEAKDQGLVGEQPNGYLGLVGSRPDAADLVKMINNKRRASYEKLAAKNGLQRQQVEALAGEKAIERTQAGHYIQLNGKWIKKP